MHEKGQFCGHTQLTQGGISGGVSRIGWFAFYTLMFPICFPYALYHMTRSISYTTPGSNHFMYIPPFLCVDHDIQLIHLAQMSSICEESMQLPSYVIVCSQVLFPSDHWIFINIPCLRVLGITILYSQIKTSKCLCTFLQNTRQNTFSNSFLRYYK